MKEAEITTEVQIPNPSHKELSKFFNEMIKIINKHENKSKKDKDEAEMYDALLVITAISKAIGRDEESVSEDTFLIAHKVFVELYKTMIKIINGDVIQPDFCATIKIGFELVRTGILKKNYSNPKELSADFINIYK